MNPLNEEPVILDGLLDEWLGQKRPRALNVQTLKDCSYSPARLTELDNALRAANQGEVRLATRSAAEYRSLKSSSSARWYLFATIAAGMIVAVVSWSLLKQPTQIPISDEQSNLLANNAANPNRAESDKDVSNIDPGVLRSQPTEPLIAESKSDSPQVASTTKSRPERVSLDLDSLPFAKNETKPSRNSISSTQDKLDPLAEDEIVSLIDRSLQNWWKQYDVPPMPAVSGAEWVRRVSQRMVGRSAIEAEVERFSKKDSPTARLEWLHQQAGSQEFTRYWGKRLAAFYFGEPLNQPGDIAVERKEFVKWCQNELKRSGMRADVVTSKVLKLASNAIGESEKFSPDHYWWTENGKRGNTYVADLISNRFLEHRGTCDRCHDSNKVARADQARYWGLAAVTRGVKAEQSSDGSKWSVAYRSAIEPLFYEREDSTMVAAAPALPNGKSLLPLMNQTNVTGSAEKNLNDLSDWLVSSDAFARVQVNLVWQVLFGTPLAGPIAIDDQDARVERQALLNILSRQLVANDFDMRRLVTWLSASQAFSRKTLDLDGNWYLVAGEKELELAHRRQALLAAFPVVNDPQLRSMQRLVAWSEGILPVQGNQNGVLAQPTPSTNPGKAIANSIKMLNRDRLTKLTPGQVQYLVNVYTLPNELEQEIDRLLKTKLPWNQLVEHAFFMTGGRSPSFNELEASQRLLDLTRDRRQTLHRIVASRL